MYDNDYANKATLAQTQMPGQLIRPTRRQQLHDHRAMLTHHLEVVDKALAALDAHPELEEFAEALSRAGV